ncbi:MAG: hypothetical protein EOP83_20740 [Verrucomicrobiaceae bacterium]|nr:MAG: hypothetical protein EOP83_20740 [Verrucomicrobiaceae bacterium]
MKASHPHPVGHVLVPAFAIGSLSIVLVAGLAALNILARVNLVIAKIVSQEESASFPQALPGWSVWLATVVMVFALAFTILSVAGTWRRFVLWITSVVLVAGWAPVLSLTAHAPDIGAPVIAVLWSGVCALVYAGNHRMPVDGIPSGPQP